jgi:hypothetical protein
MAMLIGNNIVGSLFFLWGFTDESDRFVRISFSDLNLLIQTVLFYSDCFNDSRVFTKVFFKFMPMV